MNLIERERLEKLAESWEDEASELDCEAESLHAKQLRAALAEREPPPTQSYGSTRQGDVVNNLRELRNATATLISKHPNGCWYSHAARRCDEVGAVLDVTDAALAALEKEKP